MKIIKEVFENEKGVFTYQIDKENHVHCFTSDNPDLTDDEIDNKILEMNKPSEPSDDFKARQYKHDREKSYPSIQECVHALLDGGDTLTELQARRQEINDKYPKPEST